MNTIKNIWKTVIKSNRNLIFQKSIHPAIPTWCSCFFLFHWNNPKPKQNHQIFSSRAKTRSTRSQACVKYRRNIICIKRNTDVKHRWTKNTSQKNVQIRLIFQTLSLISPTLYVVCLQHYSWLENYGCYGSFGTIILGSLIDSPVLWLLSSRNTLSVTHSDKPS